MPEGPEIRRAADGVEKAIAGRLLEEVYFAFPRLKRYQRELCGQRVIEVRTRGKAMLTCFEDGRILYSHNQLYGKWIIQRRGTLPNTNRSLRVALHTAEKSALLYSASDVELLDASAVETHEFLTRVGPDILDRNLGRTQVIERLASDRFRRRTLGALYLDQSFLAGLGNYLRSEILFRAGLDAHLRPADLDDRGLQCLADQTLVISRRAYSQRGITVDAAIFKPLKKAGQGFAEYRFWVFSRGGRPCRRCGETVVKSTHSGRNWFYCASCQSV